MAPASPASQEAARAGSLLWFWASLPQGPNYGTRSITVHLLSEPQFLGGLIGSSVGNKTLLDQRTDDSFSPTSLFPLRIGSVLPGRRTFHLIRRSFLAPPSVAERAACS